MAANSRMVSITQAFAVDLTGQVCVDQFEGEFYGGVSTQPRSFAVRPAHEGGKPIVCLASTTESGASRIKPLLEIGDGVGIARSDVHYVVTEYGIAYLFGKSIRERALALIEIAHPRPPGSPPGNRQAAWLRAAEQYLASQAAYPVQEERRVIQGNGAEVLMRPARAADADALRALFHFLAGRRLHAILPARAVALLSSLQTLCNVNHETQVAFLAVTGPRESEVIVGSACYFLNPTTNLAEVAFMVAPQWQGIGLGSALQPRLQEFAVARGVRDFVTEILPSDARMVRLAPGRRARRRRRRPGYDPHHHPLSGPHTCRRGRCDRSVCGPDQAPRPEMTVSVMPALSRNPACSFSTC